MNVERYFFFRKFSKKFANILHRKFYSYLIKKANLEIPEPASLEETEKGVITIYLSGRKSRIEQFLFGGLLIERGKWVPRISIL